MVRCRLDQVERKKQAYIPGDEIEILDVGPENGGALDEAKMSGQRVAGGINGH